ncbi:MAG: hypothetical protein M3R69_08950, partial [Acidobacteriota bacterium]|nr:hypothetical protein [Acidobacteriota bacterium]
SPAGCVLIWSATTCRRFGRCDMSHPAFRRGLFDETQRRAATGQSGDRSPHSKLRQYHPAARF